MYSIISSLFNEILFNFFQISANPLPRKPLSAQVNATQSRLNQNSTNLFLKYFNSINQTHTSNSTFNFLANNQTLLNNNGSFAYTQKRRLCRYPSPGSPLCPDGYHCVNVCRCQCECPGHQPSMCCPPSMQCDVNNNPLYPPKRVFVG